MKHFSSASLALASVFVAGSVLAKPTVPVALKVSETAQGGYVLGNPQAKVRLVEYMSYTCPHCAHFTNEGAAPLKRDFVRGGAIAYEVRNAVRDPFDLTAALLARCGGPSRFFGNMEAIFAGQTSWMSKAQKLDTAAVAKVGKTAPEMATKMVAQGVGLTAIMRGRGLSIAQINRCLSDKAAQAKIIAMTTDAWDMRKIPGTPAFFINDAVVDGTNTYAQLEPKLKASVAAISLKTEVKP